MLPVADGVPRAARALATEALIVGRQESMSSASLQRWESERAAELDRIEVAHRAMGGTARGRRWATVQINHAYIVLLSSQFQGFCRDLHSECVDHIVRAVTPAILHTALRAEFVFGRKLDRGNPNPGNIGSDFSRLGIHFWAEVHAHDSRSKDRQERLARMSDWRNAIAHQDFSGQLIPPALTLPVIRRWRGGCTGLARSFDRVMRRYIASIPGAPPL